ncbi:hypothetical protein XH88_25915, partial [Bradyrhizobium sp. CCBAU 51627]|nr:hypothetical protein [Bradyrhizobium sp. CCBAU 51627]
MTIIVSSGQTEIVSSGTETGTMVLNGGTQLVQAQGQTIGTIVSSGGIQDVYRPNIGNTTSASGTIVKSGGTQYVHFGATAKATTVEAGGVVQVYNHGVVSSTVVNQGATLNVFTPSVSTDGAGGGSSFDTVVSSGGTEQVFTGGYSVGTRVLAGGNQIVREATSYDFMGEAQNTILSGGTQDVAGGYALRTVISSGGVQYVHSGQQPESVNFNSHIYSAGLAEDTIISQGGVQQVYSGGLINRTTIGAYGVAVVFDGGHASATNVNGSGALIVSSGGGVTGTTLTSGGQEYVNSGGVASGTIVNVGSQTIQGGGLASGTVVSSGGLQNVLGSGSLAVGTIINSGANQLIQRGGVVSAATISGGGVQYILGGVVSQTVLSSGAIQNVNSGYFPASLGYGGGIASSTTVYSGAIENVFSGGLAAGTLLSGGLQNISSGGQASGAQIYSGGQLIVSSGGVAVATVVSSGGTEFVSAGGNASSTVIAGGILEIAGGGSTGAGPIVFSGSGGVLRLDGTTMPTGVVSGLTIGNTIDLAGVTFSAGGTAQLLSGNTLNIVEGANTYNLKLETGVDYSGRHFQLGHDGGTGVLISVRSNVAPVASATDKTATHNQSFAASSLFSATDADGDAIMAYQLWDSTPDPASGRWSVGGVAQGSNVAIDISAAQLASTMFQSGSGSDELYVRAYDGTAWSAWKQFFVNGPVDRAPVVTAVNTTAAHGQTSIAASSLFSTTDADGDAITQYSLWDTEGNGRWVVNGVNQATNAEIVITAAQLAQTSYVFGSATDHLYARAFDGELWGNWMGFTATPFANTAPTVSVSNLAAAHGQSLAASSMFTVSDVDGDTITTYSFWDSNANGRFTVNGVAQAANTEIVVGAAQLPNTFYVSGSGTDQLYVRAFDGTAWSAWQSFTVTAPVNQAPLVTATNAAIASGHSVAASSLFVASDPNGDPITTYSFWDSNTSGRFTINGVAQAANTEIIVSAAQLASTSYVAGSDTDQLYVRASDGSSWSAWQAFTAGPTAPVVTAANVALAVGQSRAASGLFTASDADGEGITQYGLWDTEGSG